MRHRLHDAASGRCAEVLARGPVQRWAEAPSAWAGAFSTWMWQLWTTSPHSIPQFDQQDGVGQRGIIALLKWMLMTESSAT